MNADYASVTDQSGIFAGNGGFDITVGNHTQLNGGVIASGATSDQNRLDTGTLGWNDIRNKADYSVESSSASMSSSGNTASQFMGNMANGMLAGLNNDGSATSTTGSAVADGTIVIRDKEKQTQDVAELSRDTDNAHSTLAPIFDAAKEQQRIDENRAIAQIGSQVADIVRTEGKIAAQEAAKNPDNLAAAKAALEAEGKTPTGEDIARRAYDTALNDYGTGSDKQKAVQAITAAIQGLTGGDWGSAVAGAAAPYMAEYIKTHTAEGAERIISHALAGAVVADMQGGNAAAGAAGAGLSAAGAKYIAEALYPGKDIKDLSEEEKQGVVALATLASGIAGGVVGGEVSSGIDGAKGGQNEVSNNLFGGTEWGQEQKVKAHGEDVLSCATAPNSASCQRGLAENQAYATAMATAGLIYIPGGMQVTAGIGGTANAGIQYTINGEINPMDVLIATYVGAFTANTGLWGTVGWNAAGGATSNYLKGDAPLTGAGWGAAGSAFGYSIGKVVQIPLDKVLNPSWKNWEWVDMGMGISKPLSQSSVPGMAGTAASSFATESMEQGVPKAIDNLNKGGK